jgi:hypothetical protein
VIKNAIKTRSHISFRVPMLVMKKCLMDNLEWLTIYIERTNERKRK